MLKIYAFGPAPGLPDWSPFVIKAMTLLKMAGVDYVVDTSGFRKAPKGKLPYIEDDGVMVADSTFIRLHLEKTRAIDFDRASRRKSARRAGPSRKCARITCSGSWRATAGKTTRILSAGSERFSIRFCRRRRAGSGNGRCDAAS
ncbi:glutathione S-transferase N-terminal domain-containing protein [Methylocystis sp. MJC1]|uniref:glutathione S-transferase N-terminal domain-containing protein n=1 Tax=Methylocystis sp. MJC1 TaxID=2654282 RepID=UPI001FEEA11D|nr:glutathione S-transferase N-terminal domain-containing protein [Methylocystis sp. MJC1]